jgi:acyl-CoA hydrolase
MLENAKNPYILLRYPSLIFVRPVLSGIVVDLESRVGYVGW